MEKPYEDYDIVDSVVKKSAMDCGGTTVYRFPDFKIEMTGRLLIGKQICCMVKKEAALEVLVPDPAWAFTPLGTRIRPWISIGTFSVDGEKRSMRPRSPADVALLKQIAVAATEFSKRMSDAIRN